MSLGICIGVMPHYMTSDDADHALRDEIAAVLESVGEPPYRDHPERQREAHASLRGGDGCGPTQLRKACDVFERAMGRPPLIGLVHVHLPRRLPDIVQGRVGWYASLDAAWDDWVLLGRLLGVLGAEELDVSDENAERISHEEPLEGEGEDDVDFDLATARSAWFVFFEGLRVARRCGHALRVI